MRYRMASHNRLSLALSAEKDPGEPFRGNGGWDSYGGHLMLRNVGCLRTALLGDYRLGFGQGLVVNMGFDTGKNSLMQHPSRGIRPRCGTGEDNYLRGAALTLGLRDVELSAWLSHRRLDATLNADGTVATLVTGGLHRTTTELAHKHAAASTTAGANMAWDHGPWHLGTTGLYQHFARPLSPGPALYRQIYPRGSHFGIVGMDYAYTGRLFSLSGETAYSTQRGGWATLARAVWKAHPRYTLTAYGRFYSYRYYSFYASAIAENSRVQNESGATLRLDAQPLGALLLTLYADFFYNPWPRYTLTHSSSGQEATLQAEYTFRRANSLALRCQLKRKERSDRPELHNRLRLQYTRRQGSHWQWQSQAHLHLLDTSRRPGWAVAQRIGGRWRSRSLTALVAYFSTPDYATRLFVSEPSLTATFRFPSLFGRGLRLAATGRCALWRGRLLAEAFYGLTRYLDRSVQGTGMQQISSPWRNDVSLQLTLKL